MVCLLFGKPSEKIWPSNEGPIFIEYLNIKYWKHASKLSILRRTIVARYGSKKSHFLQKSLNTPTHFLNSRAVNYIFWEWIPKRNHFNYSLIKGHLVLSKHNRFHFNGIKLIYPSDPFTLDFGQVSSVLQKRALDVLGFAANNLHKETKAEAKYNK